MKPCPALLAHVACRFFCAAVVLVAACMNGGAAQESLSFPSMPGRLPKTAIPLHYTIALEPDLAQLTLAGTETVELDLREPTSRLVLNALEITIEAAWIEAPRADAVVALDTAAQTAVLRFAEPIRAGRYRLHLLFHGSINRSPRGLFLIEYAAENGIRRMLASHFERADARRVFPCWDEPAFKASIELTVVVPRSLTAVSNMRIAEEEPLTPALKKVAFAATPSMAIGRLALVLGEFEQISTQVDGITVRVLTAPGKRERGRFALERAAELLRYLNDYFGVRYPLAKLDLIALPGQAPNRSENWGALAFPENRLLYDAAEDGEAARRSVFAALAHGTAQQWFGNLVTLTWWDNLWLEQGLAGWMQAKAAAHFFPQWRPWLDALGAKDTAMNRDARRTSPPLDAPVADAGEAIAALDGITPAKAQSLMRMLESYLGEDVFRAGIRRYITAHAYGSAAAADLWDALEGASGKLVASIAAPFASQPGVPLVLAAVSCERERQRVELRHERFTINDSGAAAQRWPVPVTVGLPGSAQPPRTVLLGADRADVVMGSCGEPLSVNLGGIGYYRVDYGDAGRAALRKAFPLMPPPDRVNLLADTWALVEANRIGAAQYFETLEQIGSDRDGAVWDEVMRTFARLDHLARGRTERAALAAYARELFGAVLRRLNWEPGGRQRQDENVLRARLIRVLGDFNDAEVIAGARQRFAAFVADPALLPASLRDAVIDVVGQNARRKDYDVLLALARKSVSAAERVRYYRAAARARDPVLARETLALTLTDEVPSTLAASIIATVASSGEQPELALEFVRANFAALAKKEGPSFADTFVAGLMWNFSEPKRAAELADFAPAHATLVGRIMAARAQEAILVDADLQARVLPQVAQWLQDRGGEELPTSGIRTPSLPAPARGGWIRGGGETINRERSR